MKPMSGRNYLKTGAALGGVLFASPQLSAVAPSSGASRSRRSSRKPTYRVLYNQDCTNLFSVTREDIRPEHVDRMVDEVAEGGADLMLINPNAQLVNYPSKTWQTFWDGYTPGDDDFFGEAPGDLSRRKRMVEQMKRLADMGCDYLERALACCRTKGIGAGVSLRMNDHHDTPYGRTNLISRFFLEHPEYRITSPFRGEGPYAEVEVLDYSHAEVRNHFLALIEELASNYDFDVLELDFLRFPAYFPVGEEDRHADTMSDFVARAAELLSRRKKPAHLYVRGPSMTAQAREIGLDIGRWVREGWVRGVSAGGDFSTSWDTDLESYREWIGQDCALYAQAESAAAWPQGIPAPTQKSRNTSEWVMGTNPDLFRGFASSAYARGADGIYAFNFFTAREWNKGDPVFSVLGELGDPKALDDRARTFLVSDSGGARNPIIDPPMQIPLEIREREARWFKIACSHCADSASVEVDVIVRSEEKPPPSKFRLYLNDTGAGRTAKQRAVAQGDPQVSRLVFQVDPESVLDGYNELVLRQDRDSPPVTVVALRLRARSAS